MVARAPKDLLGRLLAVQEREGSIRFDAFMELVLYDPDLGYFSRDPARATRSGDFLTSPEVSPLFGECVWDWVAGVWDRTRAERFAIIEVGAGRGTLAASILEAAHDPAGLELHLVERGSAPRKSLEKRFAGRLASGKVHVYGSVDELPDRISASAFISNELFDNLPVRRIMKAGGLKEIRVKYVRKRPREELVDAPADLVAAAQEQGLRLNEGQTAEVSMRSVPLLEAVLSRIEHGGLLAFDYGGEAHEIAGDAAPQGTLMAHRGHIAHRDLYVGLGDQDVSAHVNFTPLKAAAERLGFRPAKLMRQSTFLLERGLPERFVRRAAATKDDLEKLRLTQLAKQLYHPEAMGDTFRVLVAERPR